MFQEDRRTKLFTLGATCFGLFMVMLDNTVVNLALPTIQRELGSGLTELQWIVDAFVLFLAAFMLTGGTLGDLYGRKRAFISGLVIFTAASLLCALSPSVEILIAGRALQGLGAAIMLPSTLSILTNTFTDPKERAQAIGIWAGVSGIALAVGPAVGGIMVDSWGWQSIFYLNVPIGIVAMAIAIRLVRESKNPEGRSLDIPGQVLAIVGLGALTFAFIEANNYGWRSATIITLFVVAALQSGGIRSLGNAREEPHAPVEVLQEHHVPGIEPGRRRGGLWAVRHDVLPGPVHAERPGLLGDRRRRAPAAGHPGGHGIGHPLRPHRGTHRGQAAHDGRNDSDGRGAPWVHRRPGHHAV